MIFVILAALLARERCLRLPKCVLKHPRVSLVQRFSYSFLHRERAGICVKLEDSLDHLQARQQAFYCPTASPGFDPNEI